MYKCTSEYILYIYNVLTYVHVLVLYICVVTCVQVYKCLYMQYVHGDMCTGACTYSVRIIGESPKIGMCALQNSRDHCRQCLFHLL